MIYPRVGAVEFFITMFYPRFLQNLGELTAAIVNVKLISPAAVDKNTFEGF